MEIEEVVVEIVMGLFLLFLSYQVGIKKILLSYIVIIIHISTQKIKRRLQKE